jgi:hypothetical protein
VSKEKEFMSKPIVATLLALGIGLVAGSAGHAASVAAMGGGILPALAATDTVEQAQYVIKNRGGVVVGPRGGVAVRGGAAVVGPRGGVAVRRGAAVVGPRGGVAVRGGTTIVAPRRAYIGGGPRFVGRPAFVRSRSWVRRPYFGTIVGGIALGTIIAVAAAPTVAPAPGLCWYWVDDFEERGYWDYC